MWLFCHVAGLFIFDVSRTHLSCSVSMFYFPGLLYSDVTVCLILYDQFQVATRFLLLMFRRTSPVEFISMWESSLTKKCGRFIYKCLISNYLKLFGAWANFEFQLCRLEAACRASHACANTYPLCICSSRFISHDHVTHWFLLFHTFASSKCNHIKTMYVCSKRQAHDVFLIACASEHLVFSKCQKVCRCQDVLLSKIWRTGAFQCRF